MRVCVLLYDNMTMLDAIGPYEVLSLIPGTEMIMAAREAGEVRPDTRALGLIADHGIDDVASADLVLVPGGPGDAAVRKDEKTLDWLRKIHETTTYTTSVCTGSLILGAAGLLDGARATSHWAFLDTLREFGAAPVSERVVRAGKVVTAAGVSAGIDLALELAAEIMDPTVAQALQLAIEYDPAPPFDSGSPAKAPAEVMALVKATMDQANLDRNEAVAGLLRNG